MNTGAFGENFPYSNFHALNMDWIIKIAKDFLDQYTHIQEIIEQGETDIQTLTDYELDQLQEKSDTLKGLLQDWYDTHSQDIADELASALSDLNDWYTLHENYLNDTLQSNITTFDRHAELKAQETLESIPDDYTTLSNNVAELFSSFDNTRELDNIIKNVRIVGQSPIDYPLVFNDIRNGYNSQTGFNLWFYGFGTALLTDYTFQQNASGHYEAVVQGISISFDYDFSNITPGERKLDNNGYPISWRAYNQAVLPLILRERINSFEKIEPISDIITNVRINGEIENDLVFNDIRNNYQNKTGFQLWHEGFTSMVAIDMSFDTNATGHYLTHYNGASISFDYDFSRITAGTRYAHNNGYKLSATVYNRQNAGNKIFEEESQLGLYFSNLHFIGEGRIAISDVRNNYQGKTGFIIYSSDDDGTVYDVLNEGKAHNLPVSGHYEYCTEKGIITLDYDLTLLESGNRVSGQGLTHLISKDCYIDIAKPFLKSYKETTITVKPVGQTADFNNLRTAFEYARTLANINNPVTIELYEGTYNVQGYYTPEEWSTESTAFIGLILPDYCTLKGIGSRDSIIVNGQDTEKRHYISTININDNCTIENVTFVSNYLRYAIHDDYSHSDRYSKRVLKNCKFVHTNGWYSASYGAGIHDNDDVQLVDCIFYTDVENDYSISFHTNIDFIHGSKITLENCRCGSKGLNVITLAEGATTNVKLVGNRADTVALTRDNASVPICTKVTGYANNIDNYTCTTGQPSDYFDMND